MGTMYSMDTVQTKQHNNIIDVVEYYTINVVKLLM